MTTLLVTVYSAGHGCIGFVLARGVSGFEAFDAEQKSLGLYPTQKAAAEAINSHENEER